LALGCAKKPEVPEEEPPVEEPEEVAAETTAAAVSDIESELDAIDDLDEDFLTAELEDLDAELDFEI
jgi:hypothetical protein